MAPDAFLEPAVGPAGFENGGKVVVARALGLQAEAHDAFVGGQVMAHGEVGVASIALRVPDGAGRVAVHVHEGQPVGQLLTNERLLREAPVPYWQSF